MRRKLKIGGAITAVVLVVLTAAAAALIGPRNIVGMIKYDQRQEGRLHVGDRAPDVDLISLDEKTPAKLSDRLGGGKPTVLVFGSFT